MDKTAHRFGYTEKRVPGGAAASLNADYQEEQYPKTIIVKGALENHVTTVADKLGKSKNLRTNLDFVSPDRVYGSQKKKEADLWTAARCIAGQTTEKEL